MLTNGQTFDTFETE